MKIPWILYLQLVQDKKPKTRRVGAKTKKKGKK